jgi:predicted ester cyclase
MPDPALEQNKAIMRRMLEAYHTKNFAIVADLIDQNVQDRSRSLGFETEVRRAHPIRRVQTEILREQDAFPDSQFKEEACIAEGDSVALRWSMTGTHRGSILGRGPTGKRVETHGTEICRIRNGKIIEHIGNDGLDLLDLLFQLDLLDNQVMQMLKTGDRGLGAGHRTAPAR